MNDELREAGRSSLREGIALARAGRLDEAERAHGEALAAGAASFELDEALAWGSLHEVRIRELGVRHARAATLTRLAFAPSVRRLFAVDRLSLLEVELATARIDERHRIPADPGHGSWIDAIAIDPLGRWLAIAWDDGGSRMALLDLGTASWTPVASIRGWQRIDTLAFHAPGLLLAGDRSQLAAFRIADLARGVVASVWSAKGELAISAGPASVFACSLQGVVRYAPPDPAARPFSAFADAGGSTFEPGQGGAPSATALGEGCVIARHGTRRFLGADGHERAVLPDGMPSPSGRYLARVNPASLSLEISDLARDETARFELGCHVETLAWSTSGRELVASLEGTGTVVMVGPPRPNEAASSPQLLAQAPMETGDSTTESSDMGPVLD